MFFGRARKGEVRFVNISSERSARAMCWLACIQGATENVGGALDRCPLQPQTWSAKRDRRKADGKRSGASSWQTAGKRLANGWQTAGKRLANGWQTAGKRLGGAVKTGGGAPTANGNAPRALCAGGRGRGRTPRGKWEESGRKVGGEPGPVRTEH